MRLTSIAAGVLVLGLGAAYAAADPTEWSLLPNDPERFCNLPPESPEVTTIQFAIDQTSEVRLEVWSPDTTSILTTLIQGQLAAGYHTRVWSGDDDGGEPLPAALYPIKLIARELGGGAVLFEAMNSVRIECATPVEPRTWGAIKRARVTRTRGTLVD